MFNLSPQEKKTSLFLILTLSLGSLLLLYKNTGKTREIRPGLERSARQESGLIAVHLDGAVFQPGLYYTEENTKVGELLEKINLKAEADISSLNLAAALFDGQKIVVPGKVNRPFFGESSGSEDPFPDPGQTGRMININEAGADELRGLPGIGTVLAQRIVDYRRENGPYRNKEDLKMVRGIGEKRYEKVANLITAP